MESLKRILKSALDDRSPRFILGTIALGVVVALLAGTLIGYKLDNGGSSSSSAPKAKTTTKKKAGGGGKRSGRAVAAPVLYGSVVNAGPGKIVVSGGGKRVRVSIGVRTRAERAARGSASAIVVGSKVLYAPQPGNTKAASEIVVLPSVSGLGTPVTAVSSSSMTLGGSFVVSTRGAVIDTTTPANRRAIPKGSRVAVAYFTLRGRNGAVDVAILPSGTKL